MCLAIPGKIIRITEADEKNPRMATVDFGGSTHCRKPGRC